MASKTEQSYLRTGDEYRASLRDGREAWHIGRGGER